MTREEARDRIDIIIATHETDDVCVCLTNEKDYDALKIAMEILMQEPCEDAISRQAILNKIKEVCFSEEWLQFRVDNGSNGQRDFLINYIEQLPPATPQPKIGHWMRKTKVDRVYDIAGVKTWGIKCQCDKCYFTTTVIEDFGYYKYCPNCGSKMQEE